MHDGVENADLQSDVQRGAAVLLEHLPTTRSPSGQETRLRVGIEVRAELREGLQFAVHCEYVSFRVPATFFMALIWALPPTRDTRYRVDGRGADAGVEQLGLQIDLPSVMEMTFVFRNIGRDVAGLRFDNGQGRHGAAAVFRGDAGRALEQTECR